jgi:hypothetical protein
MLVSIVLPFIIVMLGKDEGTCDALISQPLASRWLLVTEVACACGGLMSMPLVSTNFGLGCLGT